MKIKITIEKGEITLGDDKLINTVRGLDGEYLLHFYHLSPKTTDEWRKYYFLLRDILYEDGETGYTKKELHEMAKNVIWLQLKDEPLNFKYKPIEGNPSTGTLSEQGWQEYVKIFKEWAFESFNCYL